MINNLLVLAYVGDAIYELMVREYLASLNICKIKELKELSLKFVSAKSQASILFEIEDSLTEEEKDILKRGRNVKTHSKPKYCDIVTYKYATALEVLFGYLYVNKNYERLKEIFLVIISVVEV